MFMPTPVFQNVEDTGLDPDEIKVPESPDHSTAVDVIVYATRALIGTDHDVYRDMNWYPTDGGNAVAPDVMTLPKGTLQETATVPKPKSYKQTDPAFPLPGVALEVASETDSWASMHDKLSRYRSLNVMAYVVTLTPTSRVERFSPDSKVSEDWEAKPIPELGGQRVSFDDEGELVVTLPDGSSGRSNDELAASMASAHVVRADQAQAQADEAQTQADEAKARVAQLEAQLRALGAEPEV